MRKLGLVRNFDDLCSLLQEQQGQTHRAAMFESNRPPSEGYPTLLAESPRSFLYNSGKRKPSFFPTAISTKERRDPASRVSEWGIFCLKICAGYEDYERKRRATY